MSKLLKVSRLMAAAGMVLAAAVVAPAPAQAAAPSCPVYYTCWYYLTVYEGDFGQKADYNSSFVNMYKLTNNNMSSDDSQVPDGCLYNSWNHSYPVVTLSDTAGGTRRSWMVSNNGNGQYSSFNSLGSLGNMNNKFDQIMNRCH